MIMVVDFQETKVSWGLFIITKSHVVFFLKIQKDGNEQMDETVWRKTKTGDCTFSEIEDENWWMNWRGDEWNRKKR